MPSIAGGVHAGQLPAYFEIFGPPVAYFLGGGVVEAAPSFRQWFLDTVREHTQLRREQRALASFALVADLDMAGARGAAVAALEAVQTG